MNKQQLASKIWSAANKMRSNIEANEYKDYILGFIFYRYLSNEIENFYRREGWTDDDLTQLEENNDPDYTEYVRMNRGYFIGYNNLFSTWLKKENENSFGVKDVTEALSAFNRLIYPTHKKVFSGIFDTLETGLKNLGNSDTARSQAISKLINLIKDIPMDGNQGYDVLGYIYEYLISNFAASAGKKAGEFYTPHEISVLMAEIVAYHLRKRERIEIYDPTSGSGSLLITIGRAFAKYNEQPDSIKYYAQELKKNTYNLTRMNLVMRGIKPNNIITRNGDTLEKGCDWPMFDDNDKDNSYEYRPMDAVVSNPPYSLSWDRPTDRDADKRFKDYGLAPKKKADYAFLLHDLYHLKSDGIMAIVLPHGVLFRPGDEAEIRKNLIEKNKIEAIIGLPADIFFGTPIATIVMVLRANRDNSDVLFIDASKYSSKEGTKKKLLASDIKRIFDAVIIRPTEVDKFARLVSKEEIRNNDYDLNIPKYVDSSEEIEPWNLYSLMLGGVPRDEINILNHYWNVFPSLKVDLFPEGEYVECKSEDITSTIKNHSEVKEYTRLFNEAFKNYEQYLSSRLIDNMLTVKTAKEIDILGDDLFERLSNIPLLERYCAYQALSECWERISADLEIIQSEGKEVLAKVEPNMVVVKNGDDTDEVQKGMRGRIMPFELVQTLYLPDELKHLEELGSRLSSLNSDLSTLVEEATEDDMAFLNDDGDKIDNKKLATEYKSVLETVSSPEIITLQEYLAVKAKKDKMVFIICHPEIEWTSMTVAKDGTYSKTEVNKLITTLQAKEEFPEDSYEGHVVAATRLQTEIKSVKSEIKTANEDLEFKTISTIEALTEEQIRNLLTHKWILPIVSAVTEEHSTVIDTLIDKVQKLVNKYSVTLNDLEAEIKETETSLSSLLTQLNGSENDMLAISSLNSLLNNSK